MNTWKSNKSLFLFSHKNYGLSAIKGEILDERFTRSQEIVSTITVARYIRVFLWQFDRDLAGFSPLLQGVRYKACPL